MAEVGQRPEHIDLAALVHASTVLRNARDRLVVEPHSDSAVGLAQEAIVSSVGSLEGPALWAVLEHAARLAEQQRTLERMSRDAWEWLEQLLPPAPHEWPDQRRYTEQSSEAMAWVRTARRYVREFKVEAHEVVTEEAPPVEDATRRSRYVAILTHILDKAIDLVMNVTVAAVFAVDAINAAAANAVTNVSQATAGVVRTGADLASRGLDAAEPALPWLLATAVVGAQAAAAVIAIRGWRSASRSEDTAASTSAQDIVEATADKDSPEAMSAHAPIPDPQPEAYRQPDDRPEVGPEDQAAGREGRSYQWASNYSRPRRVRKRGNPVPPAGVAEPPDFQSPHDRPRTSGAAGTKRPAGSPPAHGSGGAGRAKR